MKFTTKQINITLQLYSPVQCDSEVIAKYDSGELNIEFKPGYLYDKTAEQTEGKLSDKYTYEKLF